MLISLRQRSKTQIFEELPSQESAGFNLNGCFPQGFKCRNLGNRILAKNLVRSVEALSKNAAPSSQPQSNKRGINLPVV
jgi:hypothetical protein